MTESFDCRPNSTHVLEQVAVGLSTVVQQCLVSTTFSSGLLYHLLMNYEFLIADQESELERSQEDGGPGFLSKGLWVPYVEHLTAKKAIL